jgi:exodeoxyribonuclease V gamma subunit
MAEEVVVVPAADIANYLKRELGVRLGEPGKANGIVANVRFIYPRELINATTSTPVGVSDSPWDATRLTWKIASISAEAGLANLPRTFGDSPLAASRRVADLFDRYASHRPQMLVGWAGGHRYDVVAGGVQDWQVDLFKLVNEDLKSSGSEDRSFVDTAAFVEKMDSADLPERLTVFGVDAMSRAVRSVLAALDGRVDIEVFWSHPVITKLAPIPSGTLRKDANRCGITHPLSSRWAAHAHESLALMPAAVATADPLPRSESLLHRFQTTVIRDSPPARAQVDDETFSNLLSHGDGSIQIHACYGLARQVEALRDSILHILNQDESIRLRDILVVCSDVRATAPLLNAAFDPETTVGKGVPRLPINVLRDADLRLDEFSEAFFAVLDLITGRCSAGQLLDTAALDPLKLRFGFDDDAIQLLETWTEQLGIRYGLNPGSRSAWKIDSSITTGTWRVATDRLMMGIAVPAEREFAGPAGIVPFDGIGANELVVAGTLAEFLSRLESAVHLVRDTEGKERTLSVDEWRDLLLKIADDFLEVSYQDAENLVRLRNSIHRMHRDASKAIDASSVRFSLRDLRSTTNDYFARGVSDYWSIFEAITVTGLGGMSHVPFKVIALVGADENAFAAPRADGDDVLSVEPQVGEPMYSLRGRQNLLDLMMAARSHFIVTCQGSDISSNKDVPFAVPVQELLEFIVDMNAQTEPSGGDHHVLVRHPRHNFDDKVMSPGFVQADSPFTFDENSLVARNVLANLGKERSCEKAPDVATADSRDDVPESPAFRIRETGQILDLLEDPIAYYYEEILNVDIPELPSDGDSNNRDSTIKGDGILALTLDALERSSEGRRLLQIIAGHDDHSHDSWLGDVIDAWKSIRPLTGLLPPGDLGRLTVEEISKELRAIIEVLPQHLRTLQGVDTDCLVDFDGAKTKLRVDAVVAGNQQHEFVRVRYARFRESMLLRLWAELTLLTLNIDGKPAEAHIAARNPKSGEFKPVHVTMRMRGDTDSQRQANAAKARLGIERFHGLAARKPVEFFPSTSRALAGDKDREAAESLTTDASRSAPIEWHLHGRTMRDLKGQTASPTVVTAVLGQGKETSESEVKLLADFVWKLFEETVVVEGLDAKKAK